MLIGLALLLSVVVASPALKARNSGYNIAGYDTDAKGAVGPSNAKCSRKSYPISVSPDISLFTNVQSNANETYLTKLLFEFVTSLPSYSNFTDTYLDKGGKKQISETFEISGILCEPYDYKDKDQSSIQLLVHGIGFDSSYWNFGTTEADVGQDYSYVYHAANNGYATFRYDRLGTGLSDHPADAYNVVQGATDLAILTQIAAGLRSGKLTGKAYSKIAGVGHSYGSVQLNGLLKNVPSALETVVFTGFSANASAVGLYQTSTAYSSATIVFPDRFTTSELTNAYLATLAPWTSQLDFLYFPYYTEAAAQLARNTEQPVTQGVLFTFASLMGMSPSYGGNVHVVTGDKDFIFCQGNCYAVPPGSGVSSILDYVKPLYPSAASFSTYIPANTGHGISAHLSAGQTYEAVQSYLGSVF